MIKQQETKKFELSTLAAIGILMGMLGYCLFVLGVHLGLQIGFIGLAVVLLGTQISKSSVLAVILFVGSIFIRNYFAPYGNFAVFISGMLLFIVFYTVWLKNDFSWQKGLFFWSIFVFSVSLYFIQIQSEIIPKRYLNAALPLSLLVIALSYSARFMSKATKQKEDIIKLLIIVNVPLHYFKRTFIDPPPWMDTPPPFFLYISLASLAFWAIYRIIINYNNSKTPH